MYTSTESTTTNNAGTRAYAPQARIVNREGEPIKIQEQPVSIDISSVTVTQVNTGVSQVTVVLNNQRHDSNHRLVHPPWRYNKLDTLSFGKELRIDMRYGNERWSPMILARITDVLFTFTPEGSKLTLKGEDLLSLLKAKPPTDTLYESKHEHQIVSDVLAASSTGLSLEAGAAAFSEPLTSVTHAKSSSYLQFINSFATRMDYEVFIDFDSLPNGAPRVPEPGAPPPPRTHRFHFESARSTEKGTPIPLKWGQDIIEFKPTIKGWDLITEATATGSVPRGRGRVDPGVITSENAVVDLHGSSTATPISAFSAWQNAFSEENRPEANAQAVSVSNLDEERAALAATSVLRNSARQFLTATLKVIGHTALKPGIHLELSGLYAPFDGIYYITEVVHSLSEKGYVSTCTLRRPGMLNANDYPAE